jgi:hypothetical protein
MTLRRGPTHGSSSAVEGGRIVLDVCLEPIQPPPVDTYGALAVPADMLAQQKRLDEIRQETWGFGMSLCFIGYFRRVLIARNALCY